MDRYWGNVTEEPRYFVFWQKVGFLLIFLVGAVGEELGWQDCGYPAFRRRRSALGAALILGVIWALWRLIPFLAMGRSPEWIFWHCLATVALRVVLVWLFVNASESLFIAVLFHMTINGPWGVASNYDALYAPRTACLILSLLAAGVTAFWGPSTLMRMSAASLRRS